MRFQIFKDWLTDGLGDDLADVPIHPGPDDPRIPGKFILFTPIGGPGFTTEQLFDAKSFQVKCVGQQHDYNSAESLAYLVDQFITAEPGSQRIGGVWVVSLTRAGSSPSALYMDDANRVHFVCSYIDEIDSTA